MIADLRPGHLPLRSRRSFLSRLGGLAATGMLSPSLFSCRGPIRPPRIHAPGRGSRSKTSCSVAMKTDRLITTSATRHSQGLTAFRRAIRNLAGPAGHGLLPMTRIRRFPPTPITTGRRSTATGTTESSMASSRPERPADAELHRWFATRLLLQPVQRVHPLP